MVRGRKRRGRHRLCDLSECDPIAGTGRRLSPGLVTGVMIVLPWLTSGFNLSRPQSRAKPAPSVGLRSKRPSRINQVARSQLSNGWAACRWRRSVGRNQESRFARDMQVWAAGTDCVRPSKILMNEQQVGYAAVFNSIVANVTVRFNCSKSEIGQRHCPPDARKGGRRAGHSRAIAGGISIRSSSVRATDAGPFIALWPMMPSQMPVRRAPVPMLVRCMPVRRMPVR